MATAQEIKDAAALCLEGRQFGGYFFQLIPNVEIEHIKTGIIVHAAIVDINGKYPNTVKVREWVGQYQASEFELVNK